MMRKLVLGLLFIVESRAVDYLGIEEDINDFEVPNNPDNSNINYVAANPRTNYFRGSGPSLENDYEKDTSDYDINGHKDLIGDTFDDVTGGSTCDRPWTNWYDRDNPSGSGDWEPINLANPVPCGGETPLDIECQTTSGIDASITGEVITCNPNYGFKCVSRDQPDGRCNYDYKVKYQCCGPACERTWSNWYDRDDSSGTGDWEPLSLANPAPCGGEQPIDIECQTTTGLDAASTGEIITCNTSYGFRCVNKDQPDGRCNYDYKVRYRCCGPPCERTWTNWYNRDDSSGTGDWEPLSLATPVPCGGDAPVGIECKTTTGLDAASTGEVITCDPSYGFRCVNKEQPDKRCNYDYKVRYLCECNN